MKVYLSISVWICSIFLYAFFVAGFLWGIFVYVPFQTPLLRIMSPVALSLFSRTVFVNNRSLYMTATIGRDRITSRLLWKEHCVVHYGQPIYFFYFRETEIELGPPARHYIAISNSPIQFPSSAKHKLLSFDREKVIVLPDTEKIRGVLDRYIAQENRYEQTTPPPVEELKKKKNEPPPVIKKEKSDDPPSFTGKWDGRF